MSDEKNSKLAKENIALKEKLHKVEEENAELKDQITKLVEKIEAMESGKFHPIASNPSSQKIIEKKPTDMEEKMDEKNEKVAGKCVPNWLIEVLAWINRMEMADSKLNISSWTFMQLCWPKLHGNVKPYRVDNLHFGSSELNESAGGIYQAELYRYKGRGDIGKEIPIATIQPPKYIIGFNEISIGFLDIRVMQFIECVHSKLNAISLCIRPISVQIWQSMEHFGQIHRLFEMLAKKCVVFWSENFSEILRFYPKAFDLFKNVQLISTYKYEKDDLLIKWLLDLEPLPEQKPKFIKFSTGWDGISIIIDKIKEQFIGSTQSANFIISLYWCLDYPNFIVENEQTDEVLILYSNNEDSWAPIYYLVRHPKGQEHLRAEWEKEFERSLDILQHVSIEIKGIGEF